MILDKIIAVKKQEIRAAREQIPEDQLDHMVLAAAPVLDFSGALRRGQGESIRLIAEFKRASPSKGIIRAGLDPVQVARMYTKGGASAMSVLTDEQFFKGSLEDLKAVRDAVELPLIRKDFIIDPYQIRMARAAGADAVLLIVAALDDAQLADLQTRAAALGMAALVEVHDEVELKRALAINPKIIGVNNRDLRTFDVDFETTLRLRSLVPPGIIIVSESGIKTRADVLRLEQAGVDAILVGTTLMQCPDPTTAVMELLGRTIADDPPEAGKLKTED